MESAGSDQHSSQPAPEAAADDTPEAAADNTPEAAADDTPEAAADDMREVMPGLLLRRSAAAENEDHSHQLRQLGVTHVVCLSAEGAQGSRLEGVVCFEHVVGVVEPAGAATEELASLAQAVLPELDVV